LPLQAPNIDNRRFADIVAEARTLIPRYTPEWTDFNDNEPGMALVQLFAWMTEMMLFRMAQVPDLHYIKFLQLLGIELRPAEPAYAEVTFPLTATQPEQTVIVPKGTQVAAAGAVGDEPIIFETDEALIALAVRLKGVQVFDGSDYTNVTRQNEDAAQPFAPFGTLAREGSALLLGFGYPDKFPGKDDFPKTQLNLTFYVHTEGVRPEAAACGLPESRVFPSARLVWEYWNKREWRPLSPDKDTTQALTRSGHVLLRTPVPGELQRDKIPPDAPEELFWMRVRIDRAGYERAPQLDAVRPNTIGVTQAQTQRDEVVGGSTGRPDQTFRLAFTPVLKGTLHLEVDEGQGFEPWVEVEDFFASKRDDTHFVLNRTTGEIRFGDGEHGRIPVANVDNPDGNIVARLYRYGGGKKGNAAAGTLKNLLGGNVGVDANSITNLRPAVGGRDEETLEEGKRRAPQALKNKCRAVTTKDFEELTRQAPGVQRAKALPLTHPRFSGVQVPGAVTVIIVPDSDEPNPFPSEGMVRTVCAYLDQRRLLTTELYVIPPTYHLVRVRAQVVAQGDADLAEVKRNVEDRLLTYFHPLKGGEDGVGWEFGGDVFFSLVYRQVLNVQGVRRIEQLLIELDGEEQQFCQDVPIEAAALVYSTEHEIVVTYEATE
jgi:predicted phage baseplate assembly protein